MAVRPSACRWGRHARPAMRPLFAISLAVALLPVGAAAPDLVVQELEQRVMREGVEIVNASLAVQGSAVMAVLHRSASGCDPQALRLTIRLSRGHDTRVVEAHADAVREAMGTCAISVLGLVTHDEVNRFCASLDSWRVIQTVRELRRRIAAIEADAELRASAKGQACHDAYWYELRNTRVVLKPRSPVPSAPRNGGGAAYRRP
jgi:hypothetical protein